jgi:ferredoxin-like protein FixX
VNGFWNGRINENSDLDALSEKIGAKYAFPEEDKAFINDHIRIAMGLNPSGQEVFSDEIIQVNDMKEGSLPVVVKLEEACRHCPADKQSCKESCKYDAFIYTRSQGLKLNGDKCLNCGECVSKCDFGALNDKIEFIPLIKSAERSGHSGYAAVAPAIAGQFGDHVSMGQLRTAIKHLGFKDLVEVALFADILTIREAFEFNDLVKSEDDFYLTSCCCPVWFNLIQKTYPDLLSHMSPAISPMIASGRFLKRLPRCQCRLYQPLCQKAESKRA